MSTKTKKDSIDEKTIKDVDMYWSEDDIEKIQRKPNLYIVRFGSAGCSHMARELIQNAYDENIDIDSPGKNVTIIYDKTADRISVRDDGRGFPETQYPLDIFCTKLQSGSKSFRDQSGNTAGEFGVGLTVSCALSKEFEIKNYRKDEKYIHTIKFVDGKKVSDTFEKNPKGLHGSEVSFIPNPVYLGKGTKIDIDSIYDWVVSLSYLYGNEKKKIVTEFQIWDGMKCKKKEVIKTKPFSDLLVTICKKPELEPVTIGGSDKLEETDINGKKMKKHLRIDVSFGYDKVNDPNESEKIISYCNYTNTIDGGTHVDTVEEVICRYLQTATKNALSDREKEKIDILWNDVRTDLRIVINLTSNAQVQFMGNAKTQIGSKEIVAPIKSILTEALTNFFAKNQTLLQSYVKIVKQNAKARIELNKIKSVNTKIKTNTFDDHMDENFAACNNKGRQYKELYLVEGQQSAMGSVVDGRNADIQAVLGFRGVTANAYKRDIDGIYQNAEWRNYLKKIRYDIKAKNVNDVYYNKIIEATDADSDGFGISAGINAFHARFARPIVEAGLLYKVYPPLYLIDDPRHPFIRNKREMTEYYIDTIVSHYTVYVDSWKETMSKSQLKDFVFETEDYLDEISLIAKHYYVNRGLIEIIGYNLLMYSYIKNRKHGNVDPDDVKKALKDQKLITKLMSEIQKRYPEITLSDENHIRGVIDGKYQALNITPRLMERMSMFTDIYIQYGLYLKYADRDGKEIKGTISDFLSSSARYMPKIKDRYKGLGEADWQDIAKTIMDPAKRILVQLTLDDVDRDLKIIEMLHSNSVEARRERKKMMKSYIIKRDEIDN